MRGAIAMVAAWAATARAAGSCLFSAPGSTDRYYDLTALSGRDYRVPSPSGDYEFHLAVCGPVRDPPKKCAAMAKKHSVAAFQVARSGFCFYLGRPEDTMVAIEDGSAELGFDLVYSNGEQCADGRRREIRYHFICAERYDASVAPHFVTETPEGCHYNVTWPSRYGCPVEAAAWSWWAASGKPGDPPTDSHVVREAGGTAHAGARHEEPWLGSGWVWWAVASACAYCAVGFVWNVRSGRSPGFAAVPHGEAMRACVGRCAAGRAASSGLAPGASAAGGGVLGWMRGAAAWVSSRLPRWRSGGGDRKMGGVGGTAPPRPGVAGGGAARRRGAGLAAQAAAVPGTPEPEEEGAGVFGNDAELGLGDDLDLFRDEMAADSLRSD